jgi:hypothetical protein
MAHHSSSARLQDLGLLDDPEAAITWCELVDDSVTASDSTTASTVKLEAFSESQDAASGGDGGVVTVLQAAGTSCEAQFRAAVAALAQAGASASSLSAGARQA